MVYRGGDGGPHQHTASRAQKIRSDLLQILKYFEYKKNKGGIPGLTLYLPFILPTCPVRGIYIMQKRIIRSGPSYVTTAISNLAKPIKRHKHLVFSPFIMIRKLKETVLVLKKAGTLERTNDG